MRILKDSLLDYSLFVGRYKDVQNRIDLFFHCLIRYPTPLNRIPGKIRAIADDINCLIKGKLKPRSRVRA